MTSLIQKLINNYYRYPKAKHKEIKRFGGKLAYQKMLAQKKEMTKSIVSFTPLKKSEGSLKIYFLTGKKYIDQTLFCIFSLEKQIVNTFQYVFVDDGTFDADIIKIISYKIPSAMIITQEMINKNIAAYLPINKYPVLNRKRQEYPHIKKLTDIHTLNECKGFKLVLDSDMLFYQSPSEIIAWLKKPASPIYMIDCEEAYGYSHDLMQKLCGETIPELVNVGVIGMDSASINWILLEEWVKELEEQEGTCYYLEQALSAMLVAGKKAIVLDREAYKVNPSAKEINDTTAILQHYVDLSKMGYYTKAWKKFV